MAYVLHLEPLQLYRNCKYEKFTTVSWTARIVKKVSLTASMLNCGFRLIQSNWTDLLYIFLICGLWVREAGEFLSQMLLSLLPISLIVESTATIFIATHILFL